MLLVRTFHLVVGGLRALEGSFRATLAIISPSDVFVTSVENLLDRFGFEFGIGELVATTETFLAKLTE